MSAPPRAERAARPRAAFIAWTPIGGRAHEIAEALRGEAAVFYSLGRARGAAKLVRYLVSLAQTALYLARRRPRAVLVTNPPIFPGLLALAYGRLARAPVLLDSHPGGFGLQGDRVSARLQPLHRWLAPRVDAVLVAEDTLAERVRGWGGRAEVVHEAPPTWTSTPHRAPTPPLTVLFVSIFAADEPVEVALDAARRLPEVRFRITGETAKAPPGLLAGSPANVEWTGFLAAEDYRQALADAHLVLALTTEPTSVVRAGYEATWAGRPLLVSDSPAARAAFPEAVHVANDGASIAAGVQRARAGYAELAARLPVARARQSERWERQRTVLEALVGKVAG